MTNVTEEMARTAQECGLCGFVSGRATAMRLFEDELVVVLLDLSTAPGRVLVVPRTHLSSLDALGPSAENHLFKVSLRATESLGSAGMVFHGMDMQVLHGSGEGDARHVHLMVSPLTLSA